MSENSFKTLKLVWRRIFFWGVTRGKQFCPLSIGILWKNADPGIAEVEDAKTRIEALKKFP